MKQTKFSPKMVAVDINHFLSSCFNRTFPWLYGMLKTHLFSSSLTFKIMGLCKKYFAACGGKILF